MREIDLEKLVAIHINNARNLNMGGEEYISYLHYKDKAEGEYENYLDSKYEENDK